MWNSVFADKKDKQGKEDYVFEMVFKAKGVQQILRGVNHSQTDGNVEKWFDFYGRHRVRYVSMAELFDWYNYWVCGRLNMRVCEIPNQALVRKMAPECWMWIAKDLFKW